MHSLLLPVAQHCMICGSLPAARTRRKNAVAPPAKAPRPRTTLQLQLSSSSDWGTPPLPLAPWRVCIG
eukprot:12881028-Prorocentrum_lima.AAC.1